MKKIKSNGMFRMMTKATVSVRKRTRKLNLLQMQNMKITTKAIKWAVLAYDTVAVFRI